MPEESNITPSESAPVDLYCAFCNERLDEEERREPALDWNEQPICDMCRVDEMMQECAVCGSQFQAPNQKGTLWSDEKEFHVLLKGIDKMRKPNDYAGLSSGYYEILRYPFFVSGILDMQLIPDAFKKVAELTGEEPETTEGYHMGQVCEECARKAVEASTAKTEEA